MNGKALVIIGGGGHACVVAEAARALGWAIAGHLSPTQSDDPLLGDWLGDDQNLDGLIEQNMSVAIGIGFVNSIGAERRAKIVSSVPEAALASIVHPNAIVSPSAKIKSGSYVASGAIISTGASLDTAVLINSGAIIEHHCSIGKNTHIATGAILTGNVSVGSDTLIGAGAIVKQGLSVGHRSVLGAGSTLLEDHPNDTIWVGNPAQPLRPGNA